MPCVEIADSIVRKGRETLERAIRLVDGTPEWGGRVVYGDTDSLFVLLPGASKERAFSVGKEICERVTADNPKPVKLKFEKASGAVVCVCCVCFGVIIILLFCGVCLVILCFWCVLCYLQFCCCFHGVIICCFAFFVLFVHVILVF